MPFRDIVGHRRILDVLARAVDRDTLPPSAIFAGPSGVGKRRAAVALAQALNCTGPAPAGGFDLDACGCCPVCQRIDRKLHPDVLFVTPGDSGTIKVEQVREVVDRTGYRPFEGRRRVVVIDEAERLVPAAQNALLKTLEEPPSASIFVLITARPDALLPTVRSRCPVLRFGPLSDEEVAAALVASGRGERDARALAAMSDGSLGRALESEADALVESRDVALRVLTKASSSADPRRRLEIAKDLLEGTGGGGASDREQLGAHLRAMAGLLRDIALLAAGRRDLSPGNRDLESGLERLQGFAGDRGVSAFAAVERALAALDRNASSKIVADWVVLQI